ncbi:unnamed protein product, partial [Notodromas monacha]
DIEKAREHYLEAIDCDASSVEAIYNLGDWDSPLLIIFPVINWVPREMEIGERFPGVILNFLHYGFCVMRTFIFSGLANKKLGRLEESLDAFYKLQAILRNHPQVLIQIASIYEQLGDLYQALEWYVQTLSLVPSDPHLMFPNAGRLKVNMANICYKLGQYNKALKLYRMALDQVPNTHKHMRLNVMRNIGILFVKMGQYSDACTSFEYIMSEKPDYKTGLDLVVCYFALSDKDRMKSGLIRLLEIPLEVDDEEEKYTASSDDIQGQLIVEVVKNDTLRKIERARRQEAERSILTAAKLISPVIEETFTDGYNWCVEAIKSSVHADLANDLEINKAVMYLRQREFPAAVETLKAFEKKETKVASTAATNLSFLYFLQNELDQAEKYAEDGHKVDSYNPGALVNLGNVCFLKGDIEKAREHYLEAIDCDASSVEAIYNLGDWDSPLLIMFPVINWVPREMEIGERFPGVILNFLHVFWYGFSVMRTFLFISGLANKKLGRLEESLDAFYKLQAILRNHPQVLIQIASIYEQLGDLYQALEWYVQTLSLVPSDPHLLQKLGEICDAQSDRQQAFQYHFDSYRYYPSNIQVLDWLGSYYIEHQVPEKAVKYFERAALIQPDDVKWLLMVASCHRRAGNYQTALMTYKNIHFRFPENIECLKFLVRLCSDLGLKEAQEYIVELKKAEKAKELKEQRANSGTTRPGSRYGSGRSMSRLGSAASADMIMSRAHSSTAVGSRGTNVPPRTPSAHSLGSAVPSARPLTRLSLADMDNADRGYPSSHREIDADYVDPIGPAPERPKTSNKKKDDEDFADEVLGDDLLPV